MLAAAGAVGSVGAALLLGAAEAPGFSVAAPEGDSATAWEVANPVTQKHRTLDVSSLGFIDYKNDTLRGAA